MDRRDRIGFADLAKFAYENQHTFVCLFTAVQPALSLVLISAPQTNYKKHTTRVRFFIMGRITGFEPATPGTTNRCSNQLSYIRHTKYMVELIRLELTTPCMPCKCSTN